MTSFICAVIFLVITSQLSAAVFTKEPQDQIVPSVKTSPVEFECETNLNNPVYSWRKDNIPLDTSNSSKYEVSGGRVLDVKNPAPSDAGKYQCVARTDDGVVVSNYGELSFAYADDFTEESQIPVIESYVGNGAVLPCTGANYGPEHQVEFFWKFQSSFTLISPPGDASKYVSQKTGNLYLSQLVASDTGIYTCKFKTKWTDDKGVTVEKSGNPVSLKVDPLAPDHSPKFLLEPQDVVAEFGSTVRMECFVTGKPFPNVTWTGPHEDVDGVHSTQTEDGSLLLHMVAEEMAGRYTCRASSVEGVATATATVTLQYKPQWHREISSASVDLSNTASLYCEATASPPAKYSWMKNGEFLDSSGRVTITAEGRGSHLEIADVTEADKGMYQCMAKNGHGHLFSSAKLTVKFISPEFTQAVPAKSQEYSGNDATIVCIVKAAPKADMIWKKNGQVLNIDGQRYSVGSEGSLIIPGVSEEDEGEYTCNATNLLGSISSFGSLLVYTPTVIKKEPENLTLVQGDYGELRCQASRDPELPLTWEWKQNGKHLPSFNQHYSPEGSSLQLIEVTSEQTGNYSCCAKTDVASTCASSQVRVVAPPEPPFNVRITSSQKTSQTVEWDRPHDNGAAIAHYMLESKNEFEDDWKFLLNNYPINVTRYDVMDLLPYNGYSYRVHAFNEIGRSKASPESDTKKTLTASPTRYPSNLNGGGGELGQLVVTWEPLNKKYYGSKDITYVVEVRKDVLSDPVNPIINLTHPEQPENPDSGLPWRQQKVSGGQTGRLVFKVNQSEIYVAYEARILAENSAGKGPFSPVKVIRTAEIAPTSAPTNFLIGYAHAYSAQIKWTAPDFTLGYILGYKVLVCPKHKKCEEENSVRNFTTENRGSQIEIDKLEPYSYYKVRVAAFSLGGIGPWSSSNWDAKETFEFSTAGPPPNIAPVVKSLRVTDQTLKAKWKAVPTEREDNPLMGYWVQYCSECETPENGDYSYVEETEITLELPEKAEYKVWVRGLNQGGPGRPSSIYSVSTHIGTNAEYEGDDAVFHRSNFILILSAFMLWLIVFALN